MEEWMAVMFADRWVTFVDWMMIVQLSLLDSDETLTTDSTNSRTTPMQHQPSPSSIYFPSHSPLFSSDNYTHDQLHLTPSVLQSILYQSTLSNLTPLTSFSSSRTINSLPYHITSNAPLLNHHHSYLPETIFLSDSTLNQTLHSRKYHWLSIATLSISTALSNYHYTPALSPCPSNISSPL